MATEADIDELWKLVAQFDASASTVKSQMGVVADNTIEAAQAGSNYLQQGERIHAKLEAVKKWLETWAGATESTADAMGDNATAYTRTDDSNSQQTQQAGG